MRRSQLARLEDEALARFGRGTAVSVDKPNGGDGTVVTVWNAKGEAVLASTLHASQAVAIAELRDRLRADESTHEAPTPTPPTDSAS